MERRFDWTTALKYTKDITANNRRFSYVVDYSSFCGSRRNRFRYSGSDNNMFIVVGGLEMLSQQRRVLCRC